jgi:broad specificity phosphatase PhoE
MFFKLIFIRHEKPFYKDEGHDLTPEGVDRAIVLGKKLVEDKLINPKEKILLLHSPKPRAKGTLEFIMQGANINGTMESVENLRSSDFKNLDDFLTRKKDFGFSSEELAKEHFTNQEYFNNSPHIIETNDSKRARLYKFLKDLIQRSKSEPDFPKQVIAVSHFEIIMHLIDDVFGIESFDTYLTPRLGECVEIKVMPSEELNGFELFVSFREQVKTIIFK